MNTDNQIRNAVRAALVGGVAASFSLPLTAQAQDEDVLEQPRQTVTGSRILRTTTETSSAVTVISREAIDASGNIAISEVIRSIAQNSFGSFVESSGFAGGAIGNSAVDLRGLGSQRTLVLLDGRRMAGSPAGGVAGAQENLNSIPFAAVERIEVLRDGASAIYGSDAIAGVINIILRKDFEGVHLAVSAGRPTEDGGDEEMASLVGGISSSKGNITFATDYSRKAMLVNGDRDFAAIGLSSFGFPGSFAMTTPDLSPAAPAGRTRFLGTMPDPRCPSTLGGSSEFPNSVVQGTRCRFNYAATSANEARIKRQSVFVNSTFEISDNTEFFARIVASQNEAFGRYAPTPQVGGSPFLPTMSDTNANNPTTGMSFVLPDLDANGNALATSSTYVGPYDLSIYYRNVPGGFRDTFVDDTLMDLMVGVEGTVDLFGGSNWVVALNSSQSKVRDTSVGLASRPGLNAEIASGNFDIFGVNGPTSSTVAQIFVVDGFTDGEVDLIGGDASLTFDLGQTAAGPVSWAWGVEYQDFSFKSDFDAISNAGNIDGSAGGADVSGARTVFSAYGEALIPILSNLEVDLAVRYDTYNDFGDTVNPKVGIAWRPMDNLLLRGTYGTGFRAPSMDEMYGPQSQSFPSATDTFNCESVDLNGDGIPDSDQDVSLFAPGHPCVNTQYQTLTGGNPMLDAEESDSYLVGFMWSPTEDVTIGLDYWNIETELEIGTIPLQTILDREAAGDPFFAALVNRGPAAPPPRPQGQILGVNLTTQNLSGTQTDGLDLDASWGFGFDTVGDFVASAVFSKILNHDVAELPGDPFDRLAGQFEADTRGIVGLSWQRADFGGQLNVNYIATVTNAVGAMLSAWTTFDLQFGWSTPWDGKLSIGARNLTNEEPPQDPLNMAHPFYLNTIHNVYGRVPYVRYEQDL